MGTGATIQPFCFCDTRHSHTPERYAKTSERNLPGQDLVTAGGHSPGATAGSRLKIPCSVIFPQSSIFPKRGYSPDQHVPHTHHFFAAESL